MYERLLYARTAQSKPEKYKKEIRKQGKYKKKIPKKKKRRWRRRRRRPPNNKRITRERELRKEGSESLVVSPQAQDQSKRVPLKDASI